MLVFFEYGFEAKVYIRRSIGLYNIGIIILEGIIEFWYNLDRIYLILKFDRF